MSNPGENSCPSIFDRYYLIRKGQYILMVRLDFSAIVYRSSYGDYGDGKQLFEHYLPIAEEEMDKVASLFEKL